MRGGRGWGRGQKLLKPLDMPWNCGNFFFEEVRGEGGGG